MSGKRLVLMGLLAAAVGGCGWFNRDQSTARNVRADAFYRTTPPSAEERRQAADSAGALPPTVYRGEVAAPEPVRSPTAQRVTTIAPAVQQTITPPATAPAVQPGATSAQYLTLGAVVTEVSGTPIYADKVIQALAPLLSSQAKQKDIQAFRALAKTEIDKQVGAMIRTELEYAAAVQNLGEDEKRFAENYTTMWRQRKITEAGGSLELARRKAAAEGLDFDEMVKEYSRTVLVQVFYQKKVFPKVQVTAEDMRRYYDQHLKSEFTEVDQAQFRLIKITAKNMGGREQAIDKIKDLRDRAVRGEDFEKLASGINHDPGLMRSGGRVGGGEGWIQRGAFAITEVEEAVWKLQPGEVTEVVEVGDAFYIAKLENRKLGRVRAFEDEDVQQEIKDKLSKAQMAVRRDQVQKKLLQDSVIYPNPPVTDAAMEIAMQRYPQWAAARNP